MCITVLLVTSTLVMVDGTVGNSSNSNSNSNEITTYYSGNSNNTPGDCSAKMHQRYF